VVGSIEQRWLPVPLPEFADAYSVSDSGVVRRILPWNNTKNDGVLCPWKHHGYLYVRLYFRGRTRKIQVHRLVAMAFIGAPSSSSQTVNHKDGDKLNNLPNNLEWLSQGENATHGWQTGLMRTLRGEANGFAKLSAEQVASLRRRRSEGATYNQLASEFCICKSHVSRIVRGLAWCSDKQ
jgi:hypothetical protein